MSNIYEIEFTLKDGSKLTCLEESTSQEDAVTSILSVWKPFSPIETFKCTQRNFFQIHIPSLG